MLISFGQDCKVLQKLMYTLSCLRSALVYFQVLPNMTALHSISGTLVRWRIHTAFTDLSQCRLPQSPLLPLRSLHLVVSSEGWHQGTWSVAFGRRISYCCWTGGSKGTGSESSPVHTWVEKCTLIRKRIRMEECEVRMKCCRNEVF